MTLAAAAWMALGGGCGGGHDGEADAAPADASGPDAALLTGATAKGAYPGALAEAKARHADAVLFEVRGEKLNGGSGEVDTSILQSYWQYTFVSPGQGQAVYVLWAKEMFVVNESPRDVEGIRTITTDWVDSGDAIGKLVANSSDTGYSPPSDPYTTLSMHLAMYVGPDPTFQSIKEPIWRVAKINAPPGQTPTGQEWLVTYWSDQGGYLICIPTGDCFIAQ